MMLKLQTIINPSKLKPCCNLNRMSLILLDDIIDNLFPNKVEE